MRFAAKVPAEGGALWPNRKMLLREVAIFPATSSWLAQLASGRATRMLRSAPMAMRSRVPPVERRQAGAVLVWCCTLGICVAGGVFRLRPQRTMPSIITMPTPGMSPH